MNETICISGSDDKRQVRLMYTDDGRIRVIETPGDEWGHVILTHDELERIVELVRGESLA